MSRSVKHLLCVMTLLVGGIVVGLGLAQPGALAASDSQPPPRYYQVQPGDTLTAIARRYDLSVKDIVAWNKISNPDFIKVGQVLMLSPEPRRDLVARGSLRYPVDTEEVELLARLVQMEAGAEPYVGQVAVAAVVVNRMNSSQFPDTIKEVIYQPGQFPPAASSRFDSVVPDRLAREAVLAALEGEDPTGGALYFYNPRLAVNPDYWATRPVLAEIGNHVFTL